MWAVGIVDTTKQNEIGIRLAVKNNVTSAGWLKLFEGFRNDKFKIN